MNTHRSTALLWAILYLRDHRYSADPVILMLFVDAWLESCGKGITEALAMECGISAARECACPCMKATITEGEWLNPEDLRE